jgi:leader peptidase (prepilin peptidase) / N-methyltransferase
MEIYILSLVLGLVIGSFLNVVVYRTEKNKSLGGRSLCPKCKNKISWFDNIPLLSFLLLHGQCRHCKKRISVQYPLVEMLTGFTFLLAAYLVKNNLINDWLGHYFSLVGLMTLMAKFSAIPSLLGLDQNLKFFELIFLFVVLSVLVAVLVYDIKYMLIPDSFTLMGVVFALIYNVVADVFLLTGALAAKNQIFILEVAGLSKKYLTAGNWPINISSFFGFEPSSFYASIIHFQQNWSALILGSRTGSGLVAGLAAAGIFFLIVYLSQETWMGMGDVKLVFLLGLFLGIFKTVVALFLAFEIGAVVGVLLIIFGKAKMKTALPFGPFLIIGTVLSLLFI